MDKLKKLRNILEEMNSVLLAFSGGVDSTLLLKVAHDILGDRVLAVTADSPTYSKEELVFSQKTARAIGVKHTIIKSDECKDEKFVSNPVNRCYFCKKDLFCRLKKIALAQKLNFVLDASTLSDKKDFRPGNKAKEELGVRSPLQEARFTKEDVRSCSKQLGLATWDKPSLACLASRIPYGTKITLGLLSRIEKAETYLKRTGFSQVRLRHYNGLCRIEVLKNDIPRLVSRRGLIVEKLKSLGYDYVTLDLEGYRSGSMNAAF